MLANLAAGHQNEPVNITNSRTSKAKMLGKLVPVQIESATHSNISVTVVPRWANGALVVMTISTVAVIIATMIGAPVALNHGEGLNGRAADEQVGIVNGIVTVSRAVRLSTSIATYRRQIHELIDPAELRDIATVIGMTNLIESTDGERSEGRTTGIWSLNRKKSTQYTAIDVGIKNTNEGQKERRTTKTLVEEENMSMNVSRRDPGMMT